MRELTGKDQQEDLGTLDFSGEITVEGSKTFEDRIEQYRAAKSCLDIEPCLVYEPGNGIDVSSAEAFPEAIVHYAEISTPAVETLQDEGYNIVEEDAEQYRLEAYPELTIFMNAALDEKEVLSLNPSCYVFANNYLNNAERVDQMEEYSVLGTVPQNEDYVETELSDIPRKAGTPDDLYIFEHI